MTLQPVNTVSIVTIRYCLDKIYIYIYIVQKRKRNNSARVLDIGCWFHLWITFGLGKRHLPCTRLWTQAQQTSKWVFLQNFNCKWYKHTWWLFSTTQGSRKAFSSLGEASNVFGWWLDIPFHAMMYLCYILHMYSKFQIQMDNHSRIIRCNHQLKNLLSGTCMITRGRFAI